MKSSYFLKTAFILITMISILVASNIYTLIPIYEVIAEGLNIATSDVVIAGSLFTFFYAIGLLSFGPISDYTGRKKILVFGLLASSLTTLAVGLSTDTLSLWITRSIQGFTLASFASVVFAYSFDIFQPRERTLLVVFINTGFLIAGIFGQLISSVLATIFTWNSVFIFFAICYLLLFAAAFLILSEAPKPKQTQEPLLHIYLSFFKNQQLRKCYLIAFTLLFSVIAFYDALGRSFTGPDIELFIIRTVGLIGASLSLFTGRMIEKIGERATLFIGLIIGCTSLVAMLVFHTTIGFIVFSILFISAISLILPTIITLIGTFGGSNRAKALSLYSFILLMGASLAPSIASLFSFSQMLLLLTSLFIMNVVLCFRIRIDGV
ncbi:MFS transporter [Bacillus sp. B15-48]|uniref:MFS transporter n=1 Tax=Bacillus sp. B15-48 TaxID=1548601 RepID=UPI00193F0E3A|nr:MFS transporter [Bacillus sp. B15-48]MBM4764193.1 MFS transporter [Bacillus sp. B15-48]